MSRKPKKIDWKKVEQLLAAGALGTQIASMLGFSSCHLYKMCKKEHKMDFSEYAQQHRAKGDGILAAHQYAKALGHTDKGDNTLLIWLGKNRLNQKENPVEAALNQETVQSFKDILDQLKNMQEKANS